jgi:hypothetical protein
MHGWASALGSIPSARPHVPRRVFQVSAAKLRGLYGRGLYMSLRAKGAALRRRQPQWVPPLRALSNGQARLLECASTGHVVCAAHGAATATNNDSSAASRAGWGRSELNVGVLIMLMCGVVVCKKENLAVEIGVVVCSARATFAVQWARRKEER